MKIENAFLNKQVASAVAGGLVAIIATMPGYVNAAQPQQANPSFCSATAYLVHTACQAERTDDYWINIGNCVNLSDDAERAECRSETVAENRERFQLCKEQRRARVELCRDIGQDRYDPDFSPERFVDPTAIGSTVAPNPYFPLIAGNYWVYEKTFVDDEGEEVTETIRVKVTDKTKLIEGVTCVVVNDVVDEDGEVIEDTDDWYAQDWSGDVWYCGEIAKNYETFEGDNPEEPELVDVEGSWKAGVDYAKPGVLIHAMPQIGHVYRQEISLGNAEDVAQVVSLTGTETSPAASCSGDCLITKEYTPIEPGVYEHKVFAPGVGQILGLDMDGGREELVEYGNEMIP